MKTIKCVPQQIQRGETGQRGEITPEALEAEGWENTDGLSWRKRLILVNTPPGILPKAYIYDSIHGIIGRAQGVTTMQELITLDRMVNGVAIPSTTNN